MSNSAKLSRRSEVPQLRLPGIDGKYHSVALLAGQTATVVVFFSNGCPTVRAYEERLRALQSSREADGIRIIAVNSQLIPTYRMATQTRGKSSGMRPIDQRVILITGSTDGHGRKLAQNLAERGATVLLHGRDRDRGEQTLQELQTIGPSRPHRFYPANFASLEQVRRLAHELETEHGRMDSLVNNAGLGVGRPGSGRELSHEGYELRFQVNYLAGFLLTTLLLPLLHRSEPARVVNVASAGQDPIDFNDLMLERTYEGWRAYRQSKLAQIMFTFELASRIDGDLIAVNALHPATFMDTKMVREIGTPMNSVEKGVKATIRLLTAVELHGVTGKYFEGMRPAHAQAQAYDPVARRQLWRLSENLCGLGDYAA
jgi:NAD(P)-dependent dehydrogenase (short-subunit alcohol dehydrogenase family)